MGGQDRFDPVGTGQGAIAHHRCPSGLLAAPSSAAKGPRLKIDATRPDRLTFSPAPSPRMLHGINDLDISGTALLQMMVAGEFS
jgi:hypothetical protein